ncbi:MAG: OmpA family protein [Proteobacteria bacterium]|nr:OmpA family protein [Pseudomonadota bacterium]
MEQFFGKAIVKEKPLNYIPEISLLLLTILIFLIFASYLLYLTDDQEKKSVPGQLVSVNNSALINTSNIISGQTNSVSDSEIVDKPLSPTEQITTKLIIAACSELINNASNEIDFTVVQPVLPLQTASKNIVTSIPDKPAISLTQTIYQALVDEFKDDLLNWSANIIHLTINFKDATFNTGGFVISQQYQSILTEFCPRYISVLNKYAHDIEAISIEGHSSSEWHSSDSIDEAYINNMQLSQQRTNAVLAYCLSLPTMKPYRNWLRNVLITSGLSSSHLVMDNEMENTQYSRRVEFKIYIH